MAFSCHSCQADNWFDCSCSDMKIVEEMLKKDSFYCYSCGDDDWFDCNCSYSEYESKSEKKVAKRKKKIVKTSGEIDTIGNSSETEIDTNRNSSETEIEKMACENFDDESFVDEIKDLADETKSGRKEIEVKPKPRNYACNFDDCKSLFYTKKGLKRHIQTIHEKVGMSPNSRDPADTKEIDVKPKPRIYACNFDECKSLFYSKKGLKYHTNTIHLKLRPFKCTECSASFVQKQKLQSHLNGVHFKIKPFNCSECSSSFLKKIGLTTHINSVHLKLKPHECGQCSAKFSRKAHLKKHINDVHLNLKPFKNTIHLNLRTRTRKHHLQQHMNGVHFKMKSFNCSECSSSFLKKIGPTTHFNPLLVIMFIAHMAQSAARLTRSLANSSNNLSPSSSSSCSARGVTLLPSRTFHSRMLRILTRRSVGTLSMASRPLSLADSLLRSEAWYLGIKISGGISPSSFSPSSFRFT